MTTATQAMDRMIVIVTATAVLVWTLIPIVHLLVISLTPLDETFMGNLWPTTPTLSNYAKVITQDDYYLQNLWRQFGNSLFVAVATCALTLVVASTVSFAVGRLKIRYGFVITNVALLTYLIPAAFLAIPFFKVMANYGLLDNLWSLILAQAAITSPYAIWVLRQYSEQVPMELDEAAKMDGATTVQIYWLVYLPLITPALVATGMFAFLHAWNEYLYAFLFTSSEDKQTVPVMLGFFLSNDDPVWPVVMSIAVLYSLPPVALYYAARRYSVSGLTAGAVK